MSELSIHMPERVDPWSGYRLAALDTERMTTADLRPGDVVVRGFGLPDRTVASVTESAYVNRNNRPIYNVNYREGSGNTALAATAWDVIR